MSTENQTARVLLVGSGGIGTIAALNLELGKLARVTAVLRSNYKIVSQSGFQLKTLNYGDFDSWKPTAILPKIPDVVADGIEPFDYVVCTTKNIADVPPALVDLIKPAVTKGRSVIVMVQNGLNIEKPLLSAFPENVILSGVSLCGANEKRPGYVEQDDKDRLFVGPFLNPNLDSAVQEAAATDFVKLYSASGKAECTYDDNVAFVRWRKLLYNAVWNPICALTCMDTSKLRLASAKDDPLSPVNVLVRPAMNEVRAVALAATNGKVNLPEDLVEGMIECDPIEIFCKPSMQQDVERGRFLEYENILGEAVREAERVCVPMPTVKTLYGLCKAVQWRTKEENGMLDTNGLVKAYQGC